MNDQIPPNASASQSKIDPLILRATFNEAAQEYDSIRPIYPDALIEDILSLSQIAPAGRILEIGCGTGQATLPFAQRGFDITCLDIGPELLAVAASKLQAFPQVNFLHTSFEDWPIDPAGFDLLISATAFHWVPPEIGYPKAAAALRPGGALAIFSNEHPRPHTGFFAEVDAIYAQYHPNYTNPGTQPFMSEKIRQKQVYIDNTGLFQPVILRTYPWKQIYTTQNYLRLLNTYSDHLAMPESNRKALYAAIADLIDTRYDGQVEKNYLSVLYLARSK